MAEMRRVVKKYPSWWLGRFTPGIIGVRRGCCLEVCLRKVLARMEMRRMVERNMRMNEHTTPTLNHPLVKVG